MTGYMSIADDIRNAGAIYLEQDVVVDGILLLRRIIGITVIL